LFVLPRDSKAYEPPGIFTCAWLGILLIAGVLIPAVAMPRWLRFIHRAVIVVFVLWVAVITLAPFASAYRVIVSYNTLWWWLVICFAPQIYRVATPVILAAFRWWPSAPVQLKLMVAAGLTVACFAVVTERLIAVEFDGNRSGLLLLARERVEAIPRLKDREDVKRALYLRDDNGYDGQFMYAIAFDPFLTAFPGEPKAYQPFIDTPPYRYGRVGYPLLTSVLALNQPDRFPAVMIGLIYTGVFFAAVGVGWLAWRSGASPWWALSIALVPGYWMSFRAGLPEPLAAGLAVLGYACVREKRIIPGALLLALACLVRETSVFFVLCITAWLAWTKQPRQALLLITIALAPLSLWRLYVGRIFFPGWGFFAYWNPPDDFGAPFAGLAALWSDVSAGRYWPDLWEMRRGIVWLSAIVLISAGLSWTMLRLRPSAVTAAAAVFGVMAICFNLKNVWVGTGNAERLTTDLFLMLAIATPEFVQRSRGWARGLTLFWCGVGAYLLFGTLDSSFTRESFLALVGL
jgi:hypothetical protein